MMDWRHRLWAREGRGTWWLGLLSLAFAPLEWGYRAALATRGWAYDTGMLRSGVPAIPALAIGNLTVGGTGKTPLAAWLAGELRRRGHRPAVVTRGYGEDEVLVHRVLNPDVPIVVSANRMAGVGRAVTCGADVALLDDAFQHRAIHAHAYIVVVAAEEWDEQPNLLPRGPWREPLSALSRATLIVVTRKSATPGAAAAVRRALAGRGLERPLAQAHLNVSRAYRYTASDGLVGDGEELSNFETPLAVAGVAHPERLWEQLAEAGTRVGERWSFADHHRYTRADGKRIATRAGAGPLLATLKDAVKLVNVIPDKTAIYVPLQRVCWEVGRDALDRLVGHLLEKGSG
jgi:tetraacyldisaccharide 4'-kinase